METCLFAANFWGEKHAGFDILYQNLKLDTRSTSDLVDFLRESGAAEDAYSKSLWKLSKQTASSTTTNAFRPCWSLVHRLTESMAQFHQSLAQSQLLLMKDVQKYLEEQQKRHKSLRESEASTQEVVHAFQVSAVQWQRAKEVYNSRLAEYQRVTRNESVSTREQEKAETKLKKALDEYRYSVEKYNNLRTQFVNKMHSSCAQFQEVEASHLDHMRDFLHRYHAILAPCGSTLHEFFSQFRQNLDGVTTEELLQTFVKERGTGSDEPQCVALEDVEVASAFSPAAADRVSASVANSIGTRALEAFFGREPRAASALAGTESKVSDEPSHTSLTDLNGEEPPVASMPASVTSSGACISAPSKRREGFFRRRRNSLTQDSMSAGNAVGSSTTLGTPTDSTASPIQSSGSLSAFNIVAKRGLRRLGTPNSNGKEKLGSKSEMKSEVPSGSDDWQITATPLELPKDEEGYSIRPSDPWSEGLGDDQAELTNSDSGSDSEVDVVGRSFKGLRVNIRPVGEFAPGVTTLPSDSVAVPVIQKLSGGLNPPLSNRPHAPVLHDRRSGRSRQREIFSSPQLPAKPVLSASLIQQLPTAPALPPPPGVLSSGSPATFNRSQTVDDTCFLPWQETDSPRPTVTRPRWPGCQTWSKELFLFLAFVAETGVSSAGNGISATFDSGTLDVSPDKANSVLPAARPWEETSSTAVDNLSDVRRCVSAVPHQLRSDDAVAHQLNPVQNDDRSDWSAFEFKATGTVVNQQLTNTSATAWPTQTNHFENFTSEPTTPTPPEPPQRSHSKFPANVGSALSIPSLNAFTVPHSTTASVNSLQPSPTPPGALSVAAAFSETWRAHFLNGGGSSFSTITPPPVQTVSGELTLAFPTPAVKQLVSASSIAPLVLKLTNAFRLRDMQSKLEGASITPLSPEKNSICPPTESALVAAAYVVTVPGPVVIRYLSEELQKRITSNLDSGKSDPTASGPPYIKLDLLTYTVSFNAYGQSSNVTPPIHLCTYWRCEPTMTDFRLDYTTHWPISESTSSLPARGDLRVHLSVDGGVARMQSLPLGFWFPDSNRATWQIPLGQPTTSSVGSTPHQTNALPTTNFNTSGTIRAKFILTNGPGRPQPVALQFFREDCLASGVLLELEGSDYRLSLCKRRVIGDRYICDPPSHSPRFQLHPAPQALKTINQQPKPPSRIPLPHSDGLPQSIQDSPSLAAKPEDSIP
ncbi:FCH domain only protein 2 [Clonorchis sinensis]|uniref:FCH domain only protein 2 n=1 Tax=Clonorchis sinensis TaxID=79923 RepID=H2KSY8_CLOSI|nr:FCH domain only protein 2 [Clonorchis sinensis]